MRLKFEKGMTPELMAKGFVDFIRENNIVIGSVNMYIQTYDDDMKPVPFRSGDDEFFVVSPSDKAKRMYENDVVKIRRQKIKAI